MAAIFIINQNGFSWQHDSYFIGIDFRYKTFFARHRELGLPRYGRMDLENAPLANNKRATTGDKIEIKGVKNFLKKNPVFKGFLWEGSVINDADHGKQHSCLNGRRVPEDQLRIAKKIHSFLLELASKGRLKNQVYHHNPDRNNHPVWSSTGETYMHYYADFTND